VPDRRRLRARGQRHQLPHLKPTATSTGRFGHPYFADRARLAGFDPVASARGLRTRHARSGSGRRAAAKAGVAIRLKHCIKIRSVFQRIRKVGSAP
jgi:hypothetical protein